MRMETKYLVSFDYLALGLCVALVTLGVISIAGATVEQPTSSLWVRQLEWSLLGMGFLIAVLLVDYQVLIRYAMVIYLAGLFGLLLCFSPWMGHESHGAQSWIKIKEIPFQLQPSEFAKITTILMLAKVLSNRQEQWNGILDLVRPLLVGFIPALLVLKQPDFGTAVVYGPITLLMMYVAGMPMSYLLLLFSPVLCLWGINHGLLWIMGWIVLISSLWLIALICRVPWTIWLPCLAVTCAAYVMIYQHGQTVWEHLPEHQKGRVQGYLNPDFDPSKTNYNINQSKIALGSGGFHGQGFGQGTQSTHGFLQEYQHDFIFPVVGEQFGFLGTMILLAMFLLMILRGLDTALETKALQGALLGAGVVALFFTHILINIGMVTGLIPVTGLPLTFISYGGSFMISSMVGVGLLVNIRMRSATEMVKESVFKARNPMSIPTTFYDEF